MNGFKAFYKGKEKDVYAETAFAAQTKAAKEFGVKQQWQVTVVLCEKDTDGSKPGTQVVHAADF